MMKEKSRARAGLSIALAVAGMIYSASAMAQYKCSINGSTVYSDTPCAANAKSVRAPQDSVTEEQYLRKRIQTLQDERRKAHIERREAYDDEINAAQSAQRKQAQAQASDDKKRRCADLQREIASGKRALARYEDFRMPASHRQRQNELIENEDRYRRECR
jgi:hypothetical protein